MRSYYAVIYQNSIVKKIKNCYATIWMPVDSDSVNHAVLARKIPGMQGTKGLANAKFIASSVSRKLKMA